MTHYRFEVTPELARASAEPLARALWMQDERAYAASRMRRHRPRLRVFGVLVSVAGVALSWYGWAVTRRRGEKFVVEAALFTFFLLVFALLPSLALWLRLLAQRLHGSRARRMMEQVARKAPYQIDYALEDGVLLARVDKLGLSPLPLPLRSVSVAIAAPQFICAFPRPHSVSGFRMLYLPGAPERAALIEGLRAAGVTLLEVR